MIKTTVAKLKVGQRVQCDDGQYRAVKSIGKMGRISSANNASKTVPMVYVDTGRVDKDGGYPSDLEVLVQE